jgi:hypothetical protein
MYKGELVALKLTPSMLCKILNFLVSLLFLFREVGSKVFLSKYDFSDRSNWLKSLIVLIDTLSEYFK